MNPNLRLGYGPKPIGIDSFCLAIVIREYEAVRKGAAARRLTNGTEALIQLALRCSKVCNPEPRK